MIGRQIDWLVGRQIVAWVNRKAESRSMGGLIDRQTDWVGRLLGRQTFG